MIRSRAMPLCTHSSSPLPSSSSYARSYHARKAAHAGVNVSCPGSCEDMQMREEGPRRGNGLLLSLLSQAVSRNTLLHSPQSSSILTINAKHGSHLRTPVDCYAGTGYAQRHVDRECCIAVCAAPPPECFGHVCLPVAHPAGSSAALQFDRVEGRQTEVQGSA